MKRCFMLLLQALLLLSVFGEVGASGRRADRIEPADKAAQNLLVRLTVADPYTKWRTMPGRDQLSPGAQPHGPRVTIYLNDQAFDAWSRGGTGAMTGGSILVIENYGEDGRLSAYGVMHKLPGFNQDGADWYWLRVTADGKIDRYGKVEACISCHGSAARDYVLTK